MNINEWVLIDIIITIHWIDDIPMSELVYRVHPLPLSLRALVWNFGNLTSKESQSNQGMFTGTEHIYVDKMLENFVSKN